MKRRPLKLISYTILMFVLTSLGAILLLLALRPDMVPKAATPLRRFIGNRGVAHLETAAFWFEDLANRQASRLGINEEKVPWEKPVPDEKWGEIIAKPPPPPTFPPQLPTSASPDLAPAESVNTPQSTPTPGSTPTLTPSPTPEGWWLENLQPHGSLAGEGVWQPYIFDDAGSVLALRTFLQPDPDRPHAIVAIVAFDLDQTLLNYALGQEEPSLVGGPKGSGLIPPTDREPGKLIATFNGGFLTTHGAYGAMSGGTLTVPPKEGAGTVAIDDSGLVRIGVWGEDIDPAGRYRAWRQNASMVVHHGSVDQKVYNGSINSWGGNIDGNIITWRSALGISADNQTLYYLAGSSLSMPILAKAMLSAKIFNGILLDINAYWVHFASISSVDGNLVAEPLFKDEMATDSDRYLRRSPRDFFYLTKQP